MHERHIIERGVLLAGGDLSRLTEVSRQLPPALYATTIAEATRPLEYLLQPHSSEPAGVILSLTGRESIADFNALFDWYPETMFLFLAPEFPPHAAVARVISRHGAAILRSTESAAVIAATFIALQFQKRTATSDHV